MRALVPSLCCAAALLLSAPAFAICVPANPNNPENDCDMDGCTVSQGDCADSPSVNPAAATIRGPGCTNGAAAEICDGQDNNCSGAVDEGNPGGGMACTTGQQGVCSAGTTACVSGAIQCNRNTAPSTETCDGLDNNCNGQTDENLTRLCYAGPAGSYTGTCPGTGCTPRGICAGVVQACTGGAFPTCDATTPGQTFPDTETCDGLDNDCDGTADDGNPGGGAACSTGQQGRCAAGTQTCTGGNLQCVRNQGPVAETCNNVDDNCNGQTDEGVTRICFAGPAGTYTGTCPGTTCAPRAVCMGVSQACTAGAFPTCDAATPGQTLPTAEVCDGLDNDCNGTVDNGNPGGGAACTTGQPGRCSAGTQTCTGGSLQCVRNQSPVAETCNNIDDNCNGQTDEGVTQVCYTGPAGTYTGTCPGPTCVPRGVCAGPTQACMSGSFPMCTAATPGQVLPSAELCDGLDNNCNGQVDEGIAGNACTTGQLGVCGPGTERCQGGALVCVRNVNPSAEICDGLDNDCNGLVDDNVPARFCFDGPAGTYGGTCPGPTCTPRGQCRRGTQTCSGGMYGACMGQTLPTAEVCNALDDDCDGQVDDGLITDADNDGSRACMTCGAPAAPACDCNDADATVKPGAVETCDAVDNNCNGQLDDVMPRKCFSGMFVTPDTYTGTCPGPTCTPKGACVAGTQTCSAQGAWGLCANQVTPVSDPAGPEAMCDLRDEDCDGTVDDGNFDQDMDGVTSCGGDCNDADPAIKPGAPEICDNKDNDCDGTIDGVATACYSGPPNTRRVGQCRDGTQTCTNGVGTGACNGERTPALLPDGGVPRFVDGGVNDPEATCDGLDEDCDGIVDDGFDLDQDGVSTCAGDCDDSDRFNKPGGSERCDCKDNNCNTQIDEGQVCLGAPCHDFDYDGVTNCQGDCNDNNAAVGPNRPEKWGNGIDDDCDGAVDEDTDEDGDGVSVRQGDCDDRFSAINPNAAEVCDGFDNNCDNRVDEGFDQDGDFATVCAGDCDDMNPARSPFRAEVCGNSVDDNCDGRVDEDTDADGDGVTTCQGDCNDYNAAVHPAAGAVAAAMEVCDGQDNECDGQTDEGFDVDGDFFATCFGDCDDADPAVNPGEYERPANGKDDDCDGQVDEGATDVDMDGFSPFCGDCNDANPAINPHATEVCDRIDNDCDSYVDSAPGKYDLCAVCFDADSDGQTNCDGDCNDADPSIYRGAPELCDQKDNDCDGDTDLDPATGLRVCVDDGGVPVDAGTDDAGTPSDGGVGGGAGGGGGNAEPPVVTTSCGCTSAPDVASLALLALLGLGLRARRRGTSPARRTAVGLALAVTVSALATGCASSLTVPLQDAGVTDDAGVDGGADAGFIPKPDWPCPTLKPLETFGTTLPGTLNTFATTARYQVTTKDVAQAVLLDDASADVAGFVLRRPVPPDVNPSDPSALGTIAARELAALSGLPGSPLVRDRTERFSRVYPDAQMALNYAHGEQMLFASPTTAFSVRNRLLTQLSGLAPDALAPLPTAPGAFAQDTHMVYVFFRVTQEDLFVGAAVTPLDRFRENQPALSDLANGSHLSARNALLNYDCEARTSPALKTDFLFVIDNSASMLEEQTALANASDSLFDAFQRSGLDFRVGVITTDSDVLRGQGFTNQLAEFKSNVRVGINGNGLEMGVEFALRAIRLAKQSSQPDAFRLRDDAGLVVIFVSDEENTGLMPIAQYAQEYLDEKAVAFGIVGPAPVGCTRVGLGQAAAGTQYIELAARTGGSTGSICNPNITEVVEEILFGAIGASSKSPLARRPISGSLAVETTAPVPRTRVNGFDYDPATNTVLFFGSVPAAGTGFNAAYAYFTYIQ